MKVPVFVFLFGAAASCGAQTVLSVDINDRGAPGDTEAGFEAYVMTPVDTTHQASSVDFGSYRVTVQNSVAPYEDGRRTTPVDGGELFGASLYRDFIYGPDTSGRTGIEVWISGLAPGQDYQLSVWSYDSGSAGTRVSDWHVNSRIFRENYTFDGRVAPTSDSDYRMEVLATANFLGNITLGAYRDLTSVDEFGAPAPGVFFNALQVTQVPEPGVFGLVAIGGVMLVLRSGRRVY